MTERLLTFDGDGTLWDFRKTMLRALGETLVELRRMIPSQQAQDLTTDDMRRIRDEVATKMPRERGVVDPKWHERVRREAFAETLRRVGDEDPAGAAKLTEIYFEHRWGPMEVFIDVVPALDALRDTYVLGMVTNGNSRLEHTGLEDYFRFIVRAGEHGLEKPDAAVFELACRLGDGETNALVHVGDSLEDDVAGAKAGGARGIWLNRDREKNETAIVPDAEITSLGELLPLLVV